MYFLPYILTLGSLTVVDCNLCSKSVCLSDNYNKMELPLTEGKEGPVLIKTDIILLDLFGVHSETFTIDMSLYIVFVWQDNRIDFRTKGGFVEVDASFSEEIWRPDLFIWSLKDQESFNNMITRESLAFFKEDNKTMIEYTALVTVGVISPMDFTKFPFDSNECEVILSSYVYEDANKVMFSTNHSLPPDESIDYRKIRDYHMKLAYLEGEKTLVETDYPGVFDSIAGLTITLTRRPAKYVLVYYLPTSTFTLTSWFSFLLPPSSYPARTGLLVTLVLCQIGLFNTVIENTPNANGGKSRFHYSL